MFPWTMEAILSTVIWYFVFVHYDGIVVFLCSPRDHIDHVKQVLSLSRDAGVIVNIKTCNFFAGTIAYHGSVTHQRRIEIAAYSTNAIKCLKLSTNITEICSLLGYEMFSVALCLILQKYWLLSIRS